MLHKEIKMSISPTPEQIVYEFKVENFTAYPTYENWQNVIFSVLWTLSGSYESETQPYKCTLRMRTKIDTSNITDFVPYEQLTEAMVVNWINESDGPTINETKDRIYQQIYREVNPPPPTVITLPPPW